MPKATKRYGQQYGSPTDEAWEDWYVRFKNVAVALMRRGCGIACHPIDLPMVADMADRLGSDPDWLVKFGKDRMPVILENKRVNRGSLQAFRLSDPALPVSFQRALRSQTGYGRWAGMATPQEGEITDAFKEGPNQRNPGHD
jgi:hypothetical protein